MSDQVTLLPECLDDSIADDNPIRVVEAFVEELDLAALGFEGMTPAATGRSSCHPAMLLKIYIHGYLNRIQSSREAVLPRQSLPSTAAGSKLSTAGTATSRPARSSGASSRIEESVQRYLDALETADRTHPQDFQAGTGRLREKIATLRDRMRRLDDIKAQLATEPDGQLSLTDPDARSDPRRDRDLPGSSSRDGAACRVRSVASAGRSLPVAAGDLQKLPYASVVDNALAAE